MDSSGVNERICPGPSTSPPFTSRSRRKSCDFCRSRKRKCDGTGFKRCSFCIVKGRQECTYSLRSPHKSRQLVAARGTAGSHGVVHNKTPNRAFAASLDRCTLTASPAVGLVGLAEGSYLTEYFGCMGFVPIVSQSVIRNAMVEIMSGHVTDELLGTEALALVGTQRSGAGKQVTKWGLHEHDDEAALRRRTSTTARLAMFWSAVALGGLSRGAPIESMRHYIDLAKRSLEMSTTSKTAIVARAHSAVAFANLMSSNPIGFHEDFQEARRAIGELTQREVEENLSEEYLELLMRTRDCNVCRIRLEGSSGDRYPSHGIDDTNDRGNNMQSGLHTDKLINEGQLCRLAMRLDRLLVNIAAILTCPSEVNETREEESLRPGPCPQLQGEDVAGGDPSARATSIDQQQHQHQHQHQHRPGGVEASLGAVKTLVDELKPYIRILEQGVYRSNIRQGIGGLMLFGVLVMEKAANNDKEGAMECTRNMVDVLVRYPGLSRCRMSEHSLHGMGAVFLAANDHDTYHKVREACNSVKTPDMPPLYDWEGLKVAVETCCHPYCRWMVDSFKGRSIQSQDFPAQEPALIEGVELEADAPCDALGDLEPDVDFLALDPGTEVSSDFQDLGHHQLNVSLASDDWFAVVDTLRT